MLYSKKLITHDELMPEEETTVKKVLIGILLFAFLVCNAPGPVEIDAEGATTENSDRDKFAPYLTIALRSVSNGHYVTCNIGAKNGNGKYEKYDNPDMDVIYYGKISLQDQRYG